MFTLKKSFNFSVFNQDNKHWLILINDRSKITKYELLLCSNKNLGYKHKFDPLNKSFYLW